MGNIFIGEAILLVIMQIVVSKKIIKIYESIQLKPSILLAKSPYITSVLVVLLIILSVRTLTLKSEYKNNEKVSNRYKQEDLIIAVVTIALSIYLLLIAILPIYKILLFN